MKESKGFTIIELLVAAGLLLIVISAFMIAMANYTVLTVRAKTFEFAKDTSEDIKYIIDGMSPDSQLFEPSSFPTGKDWENSLCDVASVACSFEIADDDNDNIPDFYDPINGSNTENNSNNYAPWLRLYPGPDGSCICQLGNCPSDIPFRCRLKYGNTDIYIGITVAYIRNFRDTSLLSGKAVGVIIWYFEHGSKKYKEIRSVIFKEEEG